MPLTEPMLINCELDENELISIWIKIFLLQENASENVVCKMGAIFVLLTFQRLVLSRRGQAISRHSTHRKI